MNKQIVYNSLFDLSDTLNNYKIILVHGNKSYEKSLANTFFQNNANVVSHITVKESNPKIDILRDEYNKLNHIKYDIIIAVGGGSVIDTAKYILCESTKNKLYDRKNIKFIAIPTTAGSGSEATPFAVYYNEKKEKQSLDMPELLPNIVVLEPGLLISLPKYQKACCIADAFCQAMESFWSVKSTEKSKEYSLESLKILNTIIYEYVNENMYIQEALYGSYLAGKAIALTRTTISHALSYPITTHWNIPHGHAVSLTLSECLMMNKDFITDIDKQSLYSIFDITDLCELKTYIDRMFKSIGLERKLSSLGVEIQDIDFIIKEINLNRLSNNPYQPKYNELYELLMRIF